MLVFIGWSFTIIGLLVIWIGAVGLWRLPDFFSRIHAASLIDSFGLPLTLLGQALLQNNLLASAKLIAIILMVFLMAPTSTHALAQIAYQKSRHNSEQHHE